MLISNVHKSIIVMNSLDTRFSRNVFEAVQKTRSTCFKHYINLHTSLESAFIWMPILTDILFDRLKSWHHLLHNSVWLWMPKSHKQTSIQSRLTSYRSFRTIWFQMSSIHGKINLSAVALIGDTINNNQWNKINITSVENPNWWEANQLAIYKAWLWIWKRSYRETNPSGKSRIRTRDLQVTSLAHKL